MEADKGFRTPTGWKRNAKGFDEPPNTSPRAAAVLMFFGGIAALIFAAILIARLM